MSSKKFNLAGKKIERPEYIQALLKINKIPHRAIAIKLGLRDSTVSMTIHGKGASKRVQALIAKLLNIPYEDLWEDKAA